MDDVAHARLHGGPDAQGVPLHDFSTNGNACGPCPGALAAVRAADASRYPDAGYSRLREQLAAFHEVDIGRVVLAASASEFIFRITAAAVQQGVQAVWIPVHAYGDYAQAARAHGLAVTPESGDARLLWACEPGSPSGGAQSGLADMVDRARPDDIIVLDRAYEPLRLRGAPSLGARALDGVWQLWTPNKALGLTGVRAAYALAPVGAGHTATALNRLCPSWPLGAHGVAMLRAWTGSDARQWLAESLPVLRGWKDRQLSLFEESLGWRCAPSEASFFCAIPALPAAIALGDVLAALRARGIKLRETTSFGLPGRLRASVQPPAAQDALCAAWRQIMEA